MGREERSKKAGIVVGPATIGLDIKDAVDNMKPGEIRIVGRLKKFIIRYGTDGIITVVDLSNGIELYRG